MVVEAGSGDEMQNQFILTPFCLDQPVPGLEAIVAHDWQVNKPSLPAAEAQQTMVRLFRPLAVFVADTASRGQRPVSIAGDCCTTIGVLAGLQRVGINPTLIWFDAHGDFNTWETTPSGFLGGMPLAMLAGKGEQTMVEGVGLEPLPEAQIILTDGRDLDPGERELLDHSGIVHLPQVEALLERTLASHPSEGFKPSEGSGSLYVHFDTDIINPDEAPAMNYPTPGGPSVEMLGRVFRHLAETGRVKAVSLSSWNPDLDADGRSRKASMSLLKELLA
jgi:arginase